MPARPATWLVTTDRPSDPQRRALIRTLSVLGAAAVASIGTRLVFGRSGSSPNPAAREPKAPLETSTSSTTVTATAPPPTPSSTTTATTQPRTTTTYVPPPIVIEVISKDGWKARSTGEFRSHQLAQLTYHHTASGGSDPAGAPDRIRGYQRYHKDQGWPDVAYHYLIDQAGRIYEGRPVDAPGDTFTEYDPTGHFLPCLDGNFDIEPPSAESVDALALILAWASDTYGIVPQTLSGHRDHAATTCPGDHAYELRDELVSRAEALLAEQRPFDLRLVDAIPEVGA